MFYYHVWVRSEQYRGHEALTYQCDDRLTPGGIVTVPLRKQTVVGFVVASVKKPTFPTKAIANVLLLPPLPKEILHLAQWLHQFYPSPIGVIASQFLPLSIRSRPSMNGDEATHPAQAPPLLTPPQQNAVDEMSIPDTYLLHGRTGSGKTRIYIELTKRTLAKGRSALILCPEIGLTSQIALNFRQALGERVIVFHSQLTPKEREIAWLTVLQSTEPIVVIGARSALFSPISNLGLIVVDESHDQAYKQEQPPYYHAVRVASQLRVLHKAILVLGSATPSVTDYYLALQKQKSIIRLGELARPQQHERAITVVDIKDRTQFTRAPHLSTPLINAIAHSLDRGEQSLLYLNRRGTARVTLCEACGWQALCPNCDLPLTYHGDTFMLQCHICGHRTSPPRSCPKCNNPSISFHSFGTKAVVEETQRIFPEARIVRLDTDTQKAGRLENQYEDIVGGKVDIIIGTQMITKGLDLPLLSTLGVVLADSSLYLPDYTATERTYQLLTQVIGRIGRGHVASHAVVQTYHPKNPLLLAALEDDWDHYYEDQIDERRQFYFPPFCYLLKLTCERATPLSAERACLKCKAQLQEEVAGIEIEGPAPSFHEKAGNKYRWQLIIKASERSKLLQIIKALPTGWRYDIDPQDLL